MKRKPISNDADVKAAKRGDTPGAGAPGLFLHTHAAKDGLLTRSWFVRLPGSGKRLKRGLGAYPVVTLAEARRKAIDAHRAFAAGIDPGVRAERRQQAAQAKRSLTFGKAIDDWLARAPAFKNPKSTAIRERALRIHFKPLHPRDVAATSAPSSFRSTTLRSMRSIARAHRALCSVHFRNLSSTVFFTASVDAIQIGLIPTMMSGPSAFMDFARRSELGLKTNIAPIPTSPSSLSVTKFMAKSQPDTLEQAWSRSVACCSTHGLAISAVNPPR